MSQVEEFLNEYRGLVIGDEGTAKFQFVNLGDNEVCATYPIDVTAEKVDGDLSRITSGLATGRQVLRLQAISTAGTVVASIHINVEGRSQHARQAGSEQISHAKALAMNVDTANSQLANMTSRLGAADERAREAEERAGTLISDMYKMGDMVNRMIMDKESAELDRQEREARIQSMQQIANVMVPLLGEALVIGSKFVEHKVKIWEAQWKADAEKAASKAAGRSAETVEESEPVVISETPN